MGWRVGGRESRDFGEIKEEEGEGVAVKNECF